MLGTWRSSAVADRGRHRIGTREIEYCSATRAVARPHGWAFVIPLSTHTTYGYVFDADLTPPDEARADLDALLATDGVSHYDQERLLRFPNYTHRRFFDGVVLRIGNAASIFEPLEATAIAITQQQIEAFCRWPLGPLVFRRSLGHRTPQTRLDPNLVQAFNRSLLDLVLRNSLFVGWHYCMGAAFDTLFWQTAPSRYHAGKQQLNASVAAEFDDLVAAGRTLPHPVVDHDQFKAYAQHHLTQEASAPIQFSALSFAEIGHGIGYYDADAAPLRH